MSLRKSPVVDSDELAARRRRELEIPRDRARSLGVSALAAIREGRYVADDGQVVDWKADVDKAAASKVSLRPDAPLPANPRARVPETQVVVANETTLGAARRLHDAGFCPLSLNFANGVVPGGGVLTARPGRLGLRRIRQRPRADSPRLPCRPRRRLRRSLPAGDLRHHGLVPGAKILEPLR